MMRLTLRVKRCCTSSAGMIGPKGEKRPAIPYQKGVVLRSIEETRGGTKMARAVRRLIEILMIDEGRTTWSEFAKGVMALNWDRGGAAPTTRCATGTRSVGRPVCPT